MAEWTGAQLATPVLGQKSTSDGAEIKFFPAISDKTIFRYVKRALIAAWSAKSFDGCPATPGSTLRRAGMVRTLMNRHDNHFARFPGLEGAHSVRCVLVKRCG